MDEGKTSKSSQLSNPVIRMTPLDSSNPSLHPSTHSVTRDGRAGDRSAPAPGELRFEYVSRRRPAPKPHRASPAADARPAGHQAGTSAFCLYSAQPVRIEPDEPAPPRTTNLPRPLLTRANATQVHHAGRRRTSHTRLKTARSAFDPVPAHLAIPGQGAIRRTTGCLGPLAGRLAGSVLPACIAGRQAP
jgi:hypothetical protein